MSRPRPCSASWSWCSIFGAAPVPPSSVTETATIRAETATARWKMLESEPLAV